MKPAGEFERVPISLENLLGSRYLDAVQAAHNFLMETPGDDLRSMVGQKLEFIPDFD